MAVGVASQSMSTSSLLSGSEEKENMHLSIAVSAVAVGCKEDRGLTAGSKEGEGHRNIYRTIVTCNRNRK